MKWNGKIKITIIEICVNEKQNFLKKNNVLTCVKIKIKSIFGSFKVQS